MTTGLGFKTGLADVSLFPKSGLKEGFGCSYTSRGALFSTLGTSSADFSSGFAVGFPKRPKAVVDAAVVVPNSEPYTVGFSSFLDS